jgi:hypothetical protein
MKLLMMICIFASTVCVANAQERNEALRRELLAMEKVDQEARVKCSGGTVDEQIKCYQLTAENVDAAHTKRLRVILDQYGFPSAKLVGDDGFRAFMLLLQHSTSDELRDRSLKPIEEAFKRKELLPQDYANFIDRYHLRRGEPQIYGSGFESRDGKMVLSPTLDIKNLEKRRKEIGLPPMKEYMEMLKKTYHLEIEAPQL